MGLFNGVEMVGEDGRTYNVPANYASKSMLVEGDLMKLTISDTGLIYKQVSQAKRKHLLADIAIVDGKYVAQTALGSFIFLDASKSFYKLEKGDEVMVVVPEGLSKYCAIETVVCRSR